MAFSFEQECPQCGAPIRLEETDRLLHCPYCLVSSYLAPGDYYRFVLPNRAEGGELYHVPYLHFRGAVFLCHNNRIDHRLTDVSRRAVDWNFLPLTLGLRPQAVKMRFLTPDTEGSFFNSALSMDDLLGVAARHPDVPPREVLHRAFIGEAQTLIYLPIVVRDEIIYDGLTDTELSRSETDLALIAGSRPAEPGWRPAILPTLCPQCGAMMGGERDSVALSCSNCHALWEAAGNDFRRVEFTVLPGPADAAFLLPFWKLTLKLSAGGRSFESFADFLRLTNQPRAPLPHWENKPLAFWSPAFKIKSELYLNLCGRLTLADLPATAADTLPAGRLHPVTMGRTEALQSVKLTLAHTALTKHVVMPLLPELDFAVLGLELVFVPFSDTGRELYQEQLNFAVTKRILSLGREL